MNRNQDEQSRGSNIPDNDPSKAMDSRKEVEQSNDNKIDQDFPGYPHYPAKEDIMDQRTDSHRVDMDVENIPSNRNNTGFSQRFRPDEDVRNTRADQSSADGDDYQDIGPRTEISSDSLNTLSSENAEIGIPQNVENNDRNDHRAGTDLDDEMNTGEQNENDVSEEERQMLDSSFMPTNDEENLRRSALDSTDFEGEKLNEESFGTVLSSVGLDIPEETDETYTTAMGQGDEENKYYSLGGDRHNTQEEDPYSGPERGQ